MLAACHVPVMLLWIWAVAGPDLWPSWLPLAWLGGVFGVLEVGSEGAWCLGDVANRAQVVGV